MPHVFFLLAIVLGLIYGVFKFFVYVIDSFVLIDERFVSNVKEMNNSFLDYLLMNNENNTKEIDTNNENNTKEIDTNNENNTKEIDTNNEIYTNKEGDKDKIKMKRINTALRFDLFISTLLCLCWFFYPFMLIQLTEMDISKKSPEDKYLGKWLALILLVSNIFSLKFIKDGKLFSKQLILLVKLLCSCVILITTLMIIAYTKKIYPSNILNIILTSLWFSNAAVGIFIAYNNKEI